MSGIFGVLLARIITILVWSAQRTPGIWSSRQTADGDKKVKMAWEKKSKVINKLQNKYTVEILEYLSCSSDYGYERGEG